MFLTLTYDDEHLPSGGNLIKDDLQKFFKRLRKDLDLENRKIKYFACGEYGDRTKRPHFHAIVFGMKLNEYDRQLIIDNWRLCDQRRFTVGKCFGSVTFDSIRYVTGYIQKKWSGLKAIEEYKDNNPPFQLQSRGLGLTFAQQNRKQLVARGFITVNGTPLTIPRYFINKLDIDTEELKRNASEYQSDFLRKKGYDDKELRVLAAHGLLSYESLKHTIKGRDQLNRDLQARIDLHPKEL